MENYKIKSFADCMADSDKMVINALARQEKREVSDKLEAGKYLAVCVARHPDAKTIAKAFRSCGGVGKPHEHANVCYNVFHSLVLGDGENTFLAESAYDEAILSHMRASSPILNLIAKYAEVPAVAEMADEFFRSLASIIATKPEDALDQFKSIKQQVQELAGVVENKALEKIRKVLEKEVENLDDDDLEEAYQLLWDAAKNVGPRMVAAGLAEVEEIANVSTLVSKAA